MQPAQLVPVKAAFIRFQNGAVADLFQCFLNIRCTIPVEPLEELTPGMLIIIPDLINIVEGIVFISMELQEQTFAADLLAGADIVQPADVVVHDHEVIRICVETETFGKGGGGHDLVVSLLACEGDRLFDEAFRVIEAVVVNHQCVVAFSVVGIGIDVFIHIAVAVGKVIKGEIADFRKALALVQQREDLAAVAVQQSLVDLFIPVGLFVFHTVLFAEAFQLSVSEHGQTGHGGHQQADAEVFVTVTELLVGCLFIRIVHEVHIALQDLRVKFQRVLQHHAVASVVLVTQQVHEGAVIYAVHAERPDEVVFHHPEGFCQQQGVRRFHSDPVHDLAPEFFRESLVKFFFGQTVFGTGGDVAAAAGFREPQPLEGFLSQGHGCIKADDRCVVSDIQDGLHHRFPDFRIEVIQLSGVIPWHGGTVITVIDIACISGAVVDALEDYCRILLGEVMVFDADADVRVRRKVAAVEAVGRIWAVIQGKEAVRMVKHPVGIDPHMVRDHI